MRKDIMSVESIMKEKKLTRPAATRLRDSLEMAYEAEEEFALFGKTKAYFENILKVKDKKDGLESVRDTGDAVLETDQYNTTTDTAYSRLHELLRQPIIAAYPEEVIVNLFRYKKMDAKSVDVVTMAKSNESGVTSAVVSENGSISTTLLSDTEATMTAVKYAFRSIITMEAEEDKLDVDVDQIKLLLELDMKDIIKEREEGLADLLLSGTTAGDVWFDIDIPDNWSTTHPSMEYSETFKTALNSAITYITKQNYAPNFILTCPEVFSGYIIDLPGFKEQIDLGQQGYEGKYRGRDVYTSNNMTKGVVIVGEKERFGYFGMRIPFMISGPVYDAEYDRNTFNIRTRFASIITVSNALARVILYDDVTAEDITITDGAGNTAYYPIMDTTAGGSFTAVDGDGETSVSVTTWDSRTETIPTVTGDNKIILDVETGAVATTDAYSPTDDTVTLTYIAVYDMA